MQHFDSGLRRSINCEDNACPTVEDVEDRITRIEPWITILKWLGGILIPVIIMSAVFLYKESQFAQKNMDVETRIKFSSNDECIGTIKRDVQEIKETIRNRFDRFEAKLDSLPR